MVTEGEKDGDGGREERWDRGDRGREDGWR